MLMNPKQMGERFKFFGLTQKRDFEYEPAGFVAPPKQ